MNVAIGVVAVFFVLAAGIGVVLLTRSRRSPAHKLALEEQAAAKRQVKEANQARDAVVKPVRNELASAKKEHDKAVASARSQLAALQDPKGRRLGSYRGVVLYERWIDTPHGGGRVAGVHAEVDSQLSSRFTATRILALGIFALAAKKKTGNLYLQIDGPDVASIVECPKDDNTRARQFAVKVINAGKQAASIESQLPARIEVAEKALNDASNNTSRILAAERALANAENDPALADAIRAAEARLTAAQSNVQAVKAGVSDAPPALE